MDLSTCYQCGKHEDVGGGVYTSKGEYICTQCCHILVELMREPDEEEQDEEERA